MNSVSVLTLCLALMLFSLITVSLINRAQTRNRLINHRIQVLRRRISELEELCVSVEPLLESVIVPRLINDEVIELIQAVQKLDNGANYLELQLEQAQQLSREFNNDRRSQPLYRLMPSDAAIARAKYCLTEAARLIRKHHAHGLLQTAEMEAHIKELSWAHMMVDVISHMGHGHKAVTRGDHLAAYSYYRKAQGILINGSIDEERRHRFIREISEILKNKRVALSLELMPESDFNPEANVMKLPQEEEKATETVAPPKNA